MDVEIKGELSFPTSIDASRRVLKAVENPDIGLATLAKIVVSEPLLSAKDAAGIAFRQAECV